MSEFDNLFVYMPLAEAQAFFNRENEITVIEAFVDDPERMDAFRIDMDKAISRPLMITDWRQRNKTFFDTLQVEKNILFLILTMIVIVAAFNIISGLTMLVKDKTRDIAILRTMGATRGSILRIFLIIGTSIGAAGASVGFLLGLTLAKNSMLSGCCSINCCTPTSFRRNFTFCRGCPRSSSRARWPWSSA